MLVHVDHGLEGREAVEHLDLLPEAWHHLNRFDKFEVPPADVVAGVGQDVDIEAVTLMQKLGHRPRENLVAVAATAVEQEQARRAATRGHLEALDVEVLDARLRPAHPIGAAGDVPVLQNPLQLRIGNQVGPVGLKGDGHATRALLKSYGYRFLKC